MTTALAQRDRRHCIAKTQSCRNSACNPLHYDYSTRMEVRALGLFCTCSAAKRQSGWRDDGLW